MNNFQILLLFLTLIILGELLDLLILKAYFQIFKSKYREHHFTLAKYIYFLLFPLFASALMIFIHGQPLLLVFIIFSLLGTFLEYSIGFAYHKIVGQKLWTYHRASINGYTSPLSIPIWGMAGILFWLIVKAFS